ncbi:hypothetical protein SLEP1_g12577 [Rubroshorea leprosula]|uniref:Uncharacterized protein n=1 Tax=Rubroshorea leprosula TaxID=152421 RepID=A0AAV5IHG4_9ROSI|nr:hypothetical protein SLEP1_g12577 [Rubroshorea leprosula]
MPPTSSPCQLRFACWNFGSRSFCQLALRLSARFYASDVNETTELVFFCINGLSGNVLLLN